MRPKASESILSQRGKSVPTKDKYFKSFRIAIYWDEDSYEKIDSIS